jgi:hypothetical protein
MRSKTGFLRAQLRLRDMACSYRVKAAGRSPYVQVYEAVPPRRQRAARCFRLDDDEACLQLADLLEQAHENLLAGGPGLDWTGSVWRKSLLLLKHRPVVQKPHPPRAGARFAL